MVDLIDSVQLLLAGPGHLLLWTNVVFTLIGVLFLASANLTSFFIFMAVYGLYRSVIFVCPFLLAVQYEKEGRVSLGLGAMIDF